MSPTEAVLDRVRKLLALATSPNVHEAAAAAARAQRLVSEHRLEAWLAADGAPAEPIEDARDEPLEVARKVRKWKVVLASALAEANGCAAYTLDRGADQAIVLVGRAEDRAAVRALWDGLVRRVEWLSATEGEGRPRDWHEAFRIGAARTLAERLSQVEQEAADAVGPGALVRVDAAAEAHRAALERFLAERLRLRPGRGLRVRADAFERGRRAGHRLPLPEGGGPTG